jgi:hypothetical protein
MSFFANRQFTLGKAKSIKKKDKGSLNADSGPLPLVSIKYSQTSSKNEHPTMIKMLKVIRLLSRKNPLFKDYCRSQPDSMESFNIVR